MFYGIYNMADVTLVIVNEFAMIEIEERQCEDNVTV